MPPSGSWRLVCLPLDFPGTSQLLDLHQEERINLRDKNRRQALPAIALGHIIIAVVMVLNGTIGARLHIAFPVLNRSSFGFWFSYFSVISRVVLSMFWFGIQTYTGSECVYQVRMLAAALVEPGFDAVCADVEGYLAKYAEYPQSSG